MQDLKYVVLRVMRKIGDLWRIFCIFLFFNVILNRKARQKPSSSSVPSLLSIHQNVTEPSGEMEKKEGRGKKAEKKTSLPSVASKGIGLDGAHTVFFFHIISFLQSLKIQGYSSIQRHSPHLLPPPLPPRLIRYAFPLHLICYNKLLPTLYLAFFSFLSFFFSSLKVAKPRGDDLSFYLPMNSIHHFHHQNIQTTFLCCFIFGILNWIFH